MRAESIRPIEDMLLLRIENDDRTESGALWVPLIAQTRSRARVLAIGPGRIRETGIRVPPLLAVNDMVILNPTRSHGVTDGRFNGILTEVEDPDPPMIADHTGVLRKTPRETVLMHSSQVLAVEKPDGSLVPQDDFVLLRVLPADKRTAAGLHVPQTATTQSRAIVIAVGPGRGRDDGRRHALGVSIDDRVHILPRQNGDGSWRPSGIPLRMLPDGSAIVLIHISELTATETPDMLSAAIVSSAVH